MTATWMLQPRNYLQTARPNLYNVAYGRTGAYKGMGGLGDCVAVNVAGVASASDCPTAGGTYKDDQGNFYWVDPNTGAPLQQDPSGNIWDMKTGQLIMQVGPSQPPEGRPTGGQQPTVHGPPWATKKDGGSGWLCQLLFGGHPAVQAAVCTDWFLIAMAILAGYIAVRVVKDVV